MGDQRVGRPDDVREVLPAAYGQDRSDQAKGRLRDGHVQPRDQTGRREPEGRADPKWRERQMIGATRRASAIAWIALPALLAAGAACSKKHGPVALSDADALSVDVDALWK